MKKYFNRHVSVMLVLFIILTIYVNIVKKPSLLICTMIRIVMGLMPVILCFRTYHDTKSKLALHLLAGVGLCLFSDSIINLSFVPAVLGFMAAHIFFIMAFQMLQKPSQSQWKLYEFLVAAALLIIFGFSLMSYWVRNVAIPVSLYAVVLFMMFISALSIEKLLKTGGILFVLSDCLLGFRLALRIKAGWVSSIILFIYFSALVYISAGCWQNCGSDTYRLI